MTDAYQEFLSSKRITAQPVGIDARLDGGPMFGFQRDITRWALRIGRAALFEDCGLGKTIQQLEWARAVSHHTGKPVLIVAPLAVSRQTAREASKFAIEVNICTSQESLFPGVNVTNYQKLHRFDNPKALGGIVLDESAILKSFDGKTRQSLTEFSSAIPFRLACTATPAPNDYMELGNHAEFLGVMRMAEMLATFFIHDGGDTSKWRLKGHAETEFWKWVASWAVMLRKPSDLGYSDEGFDLPPLLMHQHAVESRTPADLLFAIEGFSLDERRAARRDSIEERVALAADLVNRSTEPWVVWCNLNAESEALASAIAGSVEVTGSQDDDVKEQRLVDFTLSKFRVLISKPLIAGHGLNWQHCPNMAFVGLSDSWEQLYQATRRCWRFGQTRPVNVHIITASAEGAVVRNIERKEQQAAKMAEEIVKHMAHINQENIQGTGRTVTDYGRDARCAERWVAHLGDCVDVMREQGSDSIDYSIYSPPFASLYTYSNSDRDLGNTRNYEQFCEHYRFVVEQLYRVLKPGRLLSFHCMLLPTSKTMHGHIGLQDFRGDLIRTHQQIGFIFHSEVVIWKDPVTAMQRTKALGLLYKQLRKDSCMSRQGVPDYLITMRKPGENPEPVTKTHEGFPVSLWQRYASQVWMDINPSDTLQRESAREEKDERHICPLQLEVIERAIDLWTNPGDLVLSPFMGIGSEGYVALKRGRRFLGVELKRSYWQQACRNLAQAEQQQNPLFQAEPSPTHIEQDSPVAVED